MYRRHCGREGARTSGIFTARSDLVAFQRVATQRVQSRETIRCGLYGPGNTVYGTVNRRERGWVKIQTPKQDAPIVDTGYRDRKVRAREAGNSPGREVDYDAYRDWLWLGIEVYLVVHCTLARQRERRGSGILRFRVNTYLPENQSKHAQHDRDSDRNGSAHATVLCSVTPNASAIWARHSAAAIYSRKCQHDRASFAFIEGNSSLALGTICLFCTATMSPAVRLVSPVSRSVGPPFAQAFA